MQSNRELIQKADMALADLAPGGLLVPKQAAKFLRIAIKKNVLSSQVRAPTMTHPTEEQPKILWTGRVLQPATSGVALGVAQRSKPTFDKMTLTSQLAKGEVHYPREMLEDQIERGTLRNTLVSFMGEKISADIEDLLINGDTTSTDTWLAYMDGLLKLATTNVLPGAGSALTGDILRDLIQTMPEEFDDQPGMGFFTNRKARSDRRSELRTLHPDSLGAGVVAGATSATLGYDDVPLHKVPRFPNNLGGGSNRTNVLMCDPKNAVMGFQRRVTLDSEFRISEQVWAIVVTLRIAIQWEHEPAVAKASDIIGV
jgi:HK97 family phage major capsid protein